jgi:hypothetical protein
VAVCDRPTEPVCLGQERLRQEEETTR